MLIVMFALAMVPVPVPPEAPAPATDPLSLESHSLLRCAAAFAMVERGQHDGHEAALKWPRMGTRSREFFVRALAQLMDETGMGREEITQIASAEAQAVYVGEELDRIMPACLAMLESSGV